MSLCNSSKRQAAAQDTTTADRQNRNKRMRHASFLFETLSVRTRVHLAFLNPPMYIPSPISVQVHTGI
jgi:hypothetical protein